MSMLFTILFTRLLNSWKACSVRCKSAVAKTRRTSNNASCCSLNISYRLDDRIASVMVVQTAHVSITDQPIAERAP